MYILCLLLHSLARGNIASHFMWRQVSQQTLSWVFISLHFEFGTKWSERKTHGMFNPPSPIINNSIIIVYFQVISYRLIDIQTSLLHCPSVPLQPAIIIHFKGMLTIGFLYVCVGIFSDTLEFLKFILIVKINMDWHDTILHVFLMHLFPQFQSHIYHSEILYSHLIQPTFFAKLHCQAQFQFASSVSVQLRTEISLIITVRPHHPNQTSILETPLGHIGSWNLVWRPYLTKLSQLAK